jgi:serine/threonine-protein kinase
MTGPPYSRGLGLVLMLALGEAVRGGVGEVEPVHVLLGICKVCELPSVDAGLDGEIRELTAAFERAGLDTAAFRRRLRARVARQDRDLRGDGLPAQSAVQRRLLSRATELAAAQHRGTAGLSDLLSAVLETPSPPWEALAAEMGVPDLRGALLPRQSGNERTDDRSARVIFTVLEGPLQGRTFEFSERTACVVGRADDCALRFPDDEEHSGLSRHHCLLDINPPDVRVRDLGSVNGTYVNGDKIGQWDGGRPQGEDRLPSPERELVDGDEIRLGDVRLRVGIRVASRCVACGRTVPETVEERAVDREDARRCRQCRTTEPPATVGDAPQPHPDRTCAACGGRLGADRTVQPLAEELCAACKGDPERVMQQLLQVAEDGTRHLYLFGGYTVQRRLGQGGMGAVYLAQDHQTEELCALKVMLPQAAGSETAKARFLREMSTIEMLRHPHLVRLHDHGCWNGIYFFVMDYCDGGDVAGLVHRRGGRLPDYQALGITLQVLDGLEHAHQADVRAYDAAGRPLAVRGLVHRDLSPRNIFLHGGMAKVGDFGLAKAFDAAGLSGLTRTGTSAGSPSYVSRQQVLDFKWAQPEVDVWAAAACLYYMLTGFAPRDFPPHVDRWRVVLENPAVPIRRRNPEVPERLAKAIDHALTEHPRIGFSTVGEFRQALMEAGARAASPGPRKTGA